MKWMYAGGLPGVLLASAVVAAQPPTVTEVAPGTPVTVEVSAQTSASTEARLVLGGRDSHVNPARQGFAHTGGGNIDVSQPSADTLVVIMTGVAVAGAHPGKASLAGIDCDLEQCFEVALENPEEKKKLELTLEARLVGLLRSHKCGGGSAEESGGCAGLFCGPSRILQVCTPAHAVAGGENLSINDHEGPVRVAVSPGKYVLRQGFHAGVSNPRCLLPCKAASAEFAPDPALDPLWISYWEPFHGARKKDLGFQVILKVVAREEKGGQGGASARPQMLPPPEPLSPHSNGGGR